MVQSILHLSAEILVSAPPVPVSDPINALVTHYGESYNGLPLGCGYGVYRSEDTTIVAVSPTLYGEMPCGTLIEVCGPGGCLVGARKDACPGCTANVFDLSEAGFYAVCGQPSGVCRATVRAVEACGVPRLTTAPKPDLEPDPEAPEPTVLEIALLSISLPPRDYEPAMLRERSAPAEETNQSPAGLTPLQAERPCERP